MLSFIEYGLAFIVIGLIAGLVSRRYMPGGGASHHLGHLLVGIFGALVGGAACLALFWFMWNRNHPVPEGTVYQQTETLQTRLYGYWISLFVAGAISLLALAAYKLSIPKNSRAKENKRG